MRKFNHSFIRILTVVILLLFSASTVFALSDSSPGHTVSPLTPQENELISNGLIFAYQDYYTIGNETNFPDYYAGAHINTDGSLTIFLTDTSSTNIQTVRSICGDTNQVIQFQQVTYSFNELWSLMKNIRNEFSELCTNGQIKQQIDLVSNQLIIFCDPDLTDMISDSLASSSMTYANTNSPVSVLPATHYDAWIEEHCVASVQAMNDTDSENSTLAINSASAMSGMLNTFYNRDGDVCSGTIGFTAVLVDGNTEYPVVVTHGHQISEEYSYSTIASGLISTDLLLHEYHYEVYDFAVYKLVGNATISNKRYASTLRFKSAATEASLLSLSGSNAYFYGRTSYETNIPSYNYAEGWIVWNSMTNQAQPGDSGDPIYMKYTSYGTECLRLIGIISTSNQESGGYGEAYHHIVDRIEWHGYECTLYTDDIDY